MSTATQDVREVFPRLVYAAVACGMLTPSETQELESALAALDQMADALRASDDWIREAKAQGFALPAASVLARNAAALARCPARSAPDTQVVTP